MDASGRETSQGRIDCYIDGSGDTVSIVQMQCEQAPSAKNENFVAMTKALAKQAALSTVEPTPENLLDQPDIDDPSKKANDRLTETINLIRENIKLTRVARLKADGGAIGHYVHHSFQEAAVARFEGSDATSRLANEICMHIVATKPIAITREDIPAELVEKERQIAKEQAAQTGKPENILEKISAGKLKTWFGEKVLLEQDFVKDNEMKVADLLKRAGDVKVTHFKRFKIGE
jgi:elongation factor Ts